MKNKELIEEISKKTGYSVEETEELMSAFVSAVGSCLIDSDIISFQGFGQFEVKKKSERLCVNPSNGKRYLVPPKLVPVFKPGSTLRHLLKKMSHE